MKKEIETISKGQEEMKNTNSKLKNIVEGMKSRLDEAEDNSNSLTNKGKTKKQNPNERKRGNLRKNAN